MKNLFACILIAFTVTTSSASFAATSKTITKEKAGLNAGTSVTFAQQEQSKLDVIIDNAANAKVIIRLLASNGTNIVTKAIANSETGTRIRFNLASLTDGVYQVKVTDGKNTQVKKFEIKTALPAKATYQEVTFI